MKRLHARLLRLTCLALLSGPMLLAQAPTAAPADTPAAPPTPADTPAAPPAPAVGNVPGLKHPAEGGPANALSPALKRDIVPGTRLTIVTQDKPLLRQDCKVEKFDEGAIICRGKAGPVSHSGQDLVAVIAQEHEFGRPKPLRLLSTLGLGGGALAGAALLASIPTAGIPLAVIGAILLLDSAFEAMDSAQTGPREELLYLNPDQRLQIDLK